MNNADIRIDVMPPQHSGGQHTPSMCRGVRATYLPTGQYAECDSEISQKKNRLVAVEKLRSIVERGRKIPCTPGCIACEECVKKSWCRATRSKP